MFRLSNKLVGLLNLVTFLLSIPIIGIGIWLATRGNTDCEKFLDMPVIVVGIFIMVVSLLGFIGACSRVSCLLFVYLFVTFLLIVLLICFTIFAFIVTNKGAGNVVSRKGIKEYKLGDYSNWLKKRINDEKNWRKIESCIRKANVCKKLVDKNDTVTQFFQENLSSLQSGCCKPPVSCNYTYVSATNWTATSNSSSADPDCARWSNDQSKLCYRCESCKAGVLANIKNNWKKVAIVNIAVIVFLIIIYSLGCCAFRNNRKDNK